jgi:hypothetical protein
VLKITANVESLVLDWNFLTSGPEPLLIEKLKLKLTTKS